MNTNKALGFWNTLPTWAKGVIAVGGLTAGYFAVRSFLNKIQKDASRKDQIRTQQNQENELQQNIDNGIRLTFPMSQYTQWADELEAQFDGCDISFNLPIDPDLWGLDNWSYSGAKLANIVQTFENNSDFLALSTAWGAERTYDQCGWGTGDFSGNLSQSVTDELSQNEINALNRRLSEKGITYKF